MTDFCDTELCDDGAFMCLGAITPAGMGHKTLREHNAVCQPGQVVSLDATGDEVCTGTPSPYYLPAIIQEEDPFRSFERHQERSHAAPHKAGHGDFSQDQSDLAEFRSDNDTAKGFYSRGALDTGDFWFDKAKAIYDASAYVQSQAAGAIETTQAVRDDADARAGYQQSQTQETQLRKDLSDPLGLSQDIMDTTQTNPDQVGLLESGMLPYFLLEQSFLPADVQPLHTATEGAAAEMRSVGGAIGGPVGRSIKDAGSPQSGRDLTTKAPIPLPQGALSGIALGAGIGGGLGALLGGIATKSPGGAVGGGLGGAILGGVLGLVSKGAAA